nr:transcription termination factor mterf9, chloroplastic [Quercus suber]
MEMFVCSHLNVNDYDPPFVSLEQSLSSLFGGEGEGIVKRSKRRRSGACRFVVLSTHSNSRILKSNRRSRFGNVLSPFDSDEEKAVEDDDDGEDDDDDDDDDDDVAENDWLPNDDFAETADFDVNGKRVKSQDTHKTRKAQERLEYLLSVGVKHRDVKRIILRQPQILEYTVENNLKSHVAFLMGLGIPSSRVGQIIAAAPSLFSYSLENSLRPTVRYLVEEVGINEKDLGKVVQLSPQILVQRIDISWNTRYIFLSKELGAPRDSVVKMVKKHPQLLHYSIDDGLLPRINFLRSIGMQDSDILKVLTSLTQVLSLSLEENLKPKYKYLINELHNEVHSLTKYPMYLSLSLDQRIRPRHSVARSVILRYVSTFQLIYEDNFEEVCCTWYKFLKELHASMHFW